MSLIGFDRLSQHSQRRCERIVKRRLSQRKDKLEKMVATGQASDETLNEDRLVAAVSTGNWTEEITAQLYDEWSQSKQKPEGKGKIGDGSLLEVVTDFIDYVINLDWDKIIAIILKLAPLLI